MIIIIILILIIIILIIITIIICLIYIARTNGSSCSLRSTIKNIS